MNREEFVARMLADRARREKARQAELYAYVKERSHRIEHKHTLKYKQGGKHQ